MRPRSMLDAQILLSVQLTVIICRVYVTNIWGPCSAFTSHAARTLLPDMACLILGSW